MALWVNINYHEARLCDTEYCTVGALNLRHKINNYFYEWRNIRKYVLEKSFDVTHNYNYAVGAGVKDLEKKVAMAGAGKITKFFECVDELLPIRWTPSAEPPNKKPKRGPGRPRKVVIVIDDDGVSAAASVAFQNGHSVTVMDIAFFPHSNSNFAHERVPDTLVHVVPSNIHVAFYSKRSRISAARSHRHLPACA